MDGSADPTRFLPTWELLYHCWLKASALFEPPIEPVRIPYEDTELHGFFFWANGARQKRPLLILINGSDGSLLDMWTQGGAAGVARGYHCLTFDGPGQGYTLWKQKLFFRPDWEKVITPVVDYALSRPEVDPDRIALQGISQGGYWVPRAVAFEPRIRCPMLITAPDNETFWPGQSQELHDLLVSPKQLVPFTVEEGADLHCEPKAGGLRDLRVFDWLDETLV